MTCIYPECYCSDKCVYGTYEKENAAYRDEPVRASPPNEPSQASEEYDFKMGRAERIDIEAIKQEIRELDALRMDGQLGDIVYHRINELLEMLDSAD